jgi:hypothetical protein
MDGWPKLAMHAPQVGFAVTWAALGAIRIGPPGPLRMSAADLQLVLGG